MSKTHETLTAWKHAVASAFAKVYDAETRGASLGSALECAGIGGVKVTSEATGLNIAVAELGDKDNVPHGFTRGDFTADKLAEMDAEALKSAKRSVWHFIRSKARRGYMDNDQAIALLDELGFTARPTETTNVSADIPTGQRDRYGDSVREYVSFRIPGSVAKDVIVAALAEAYPAANAVRTAILSAFPNAQDVPGGLADRVSVSTDLEWPTTCEYDD